MTELLTGAKQSSRITSRSWQGEELQRFDGGLNTPAPVPHQSARIFRPSRSVTTSARVTCRPWRLEFECRTPTVIDHLMGYCGSGDTLSQVQLDSPAAKQQRPSLRNSNRAMSCRPIHPCGRDPTLKSFSVNG
jgi:hypothetical protein